MMTTGIKQLQSPNDWIQRFKEFTNVHIFLNEQVTKLETTNNRISSIHTNNDNVLYIKEHCVLCIPPRSLFELLETCDPNIQNNWKPFEEMRIWCNMSSYQGIGFQFHFDTIVPKHNKKDWCWSCHHDWNIIVTEVHRYRNVFSRDPTIKNVWSCVIVDTQAFSKRLQKTVNQCSYEEIINEAFFQMKLEVIPVYVTSHETLMKTSDGLWKDNNSSFTNILGPLNQKGNIDNLFVIGACNDGSSATIMESGLVQAVNFANNLNKNQIFGQSWVNNFMGVLFHKDNFFTIIIFIILLQLCLVFYT